MTKAADYGQPVLRVRKVSEGRAWVRRPRYEVEHTAFGAREPSWARQTPDPVGLLRPFLGLADAHAVVVAADRAGPTQNWCSLFDEDAS